MKLPDLEGGKVTDQAHGKTSSTRNSRCPWPKPSKLPSPPNSHSKARTTICPAQGYGLPASARNPILLIPARRQQPACPSKAETCYFKYIFFTRTYGN